MLLLEVMKDDDGNVTDDLCPEAYQPKNVWVLDFKVESICFNGRVLVVVVRVMSHH